MAYAMRFKQWLHILTSLYNVQTSFFQRSLSDKRGVCVCHGVRKAQVSCLKTCLQLCCSLKIKYYKSSRITFCYWWKTAVKYLNKIQIFIVQCHFFTRFQIIKIQNIQVILIFVDRGIWNVYRELCLLRKKSIKNLLQKSGLEKKLQEIWY